MQFPEAQIGEDDCSGQNPSHQQQASRGRDQRRPRENQPDQRQDRATTGVKRKEAGSSGEGSTQTGKNAQIAILPDFSGRPQERPSKSEQEHLRHLQSGPSAPRYPWRKRIAISFARPGRYLGGLTPGIPIVTLYPPAPISHSPVPVRRSLLAPPCAAALAA